MTRLRPSTRLILALAVAALAVGWFLPLWEILLWAPQYPEGLDMQIWINRISGDVDIINGINHYIGMKPIRAEMFPEFGYMSTVLGVLVAAGVVPVLSGRRVWLVVFVAILIAGGALGIYDYWRWGTDYGSDLDPKAAISVPGMTYSPPVIGYKNLLNFVAYSGPDTGGWVMIGSGIVITILLLVECLCGRGMRGKPEAIHGVLSLGWLLVVSGCSSHGPQPVDYGKDECAECNMRFADPHYGSELVTAKGKVFKFDDVNCMLAFAGREDGSRGGEYSLFVIDFETPNRFLETGDAVYLHHKKLRSPMRGDVAAFRSRPAAEAVMKELGEGGSILTWQEVKNLF